MYNENIYNTAVGMSEVMKQNGFVVRAKVGSPLEQIFRELNLDKNTILSTQSYAENLDHVNGLANTVIPSDGSLVGDKLFSWLEHGYLEPLKQQVAFTRNVVLPLVRETVQRADIRIMNLVSHSQNEVKVVFLSLPSALSNSLAAQRFENGPKERVTGAPEFHPAFTVENLNTDALQAFVNHEDFGFTPEELAELQNQYKQLGGLSNDYYTGDLIGDAARAFLCASNQEIMSRTVSHVNMLQAAVASAIVNIIMRHPFVGVGLTSTDLGQWANWLFRVACFLVNNQVRYLNGLSMANQVIVSVNTKERIIAVLDDVWEKATAQADENPIGEVSLTDLLIGVMNSNQPSQYFTLNALVENKESLIRQARAFNMSERGKVNAREALILVEEIKNSVKEMYASVEDAESPYSSFVEMKQNEFSSCLEVGRLYDELYRGGIKGIAREKVVSTLLCKVMFASTMALDIIGEMEVAFDSSLNPSEEDKEALAGVALTAVVNKWLLSQIDILPAAGQPL